ncbi:MAG TPA: ATP-binding protein [Actinomycetota bacterium]|nr:ATP-binding protein [Actinomycetota bacterium]
MDRRAAVVLDAVPEAPRRARRFLSENLAVWERLDLMERAALALSELVTNAFLHAHGDIEVVAVLGDALRVEVRDSGPRQPQPRHYSVLSATGRGLQLVEQTVDRWGTTPSREGAGRKSVWFELDAGVEGETVPQGSGARRDSRRDAPAAARRAHPARELATARSRPPAACREAA